MFTIGKLASLTSVSNDTLRYYKQAVFGGRMYRALKNWPNITIQVTAAVAMLLSLTWHAQAGHWEAYHGWHYGPHHDWHGGPHYGPHSGFHWDPTYGWHYGEHYGPHSGYHHDWHYGPHHDWY
jgi:hypothetical protein